MKKEKAPVYLRWYIFVLLILFCSWTSKIPLLSSIFCLAAMIQLIIRIRWGKHHREQRQSIPDEIPNQPVPSMSESSPFPETIQQIQTTEKLLDELEQKLTTQRTPSQPTKLSAERSPEPETKQHTQTAPESFVLPESESTIEPPPEQSMEEIEQPAQKQKPVIAERQEEFDHTLDTLSRVEITLNDCNPEKISREMPEIKYSNVTKRTNFDKLGNFVSIDTETTGLKAGRDRIIEISAIRFDHWEPVEIFETLINPEKPISAVATAINHITDEMVKNAPLILQVMPALNAFIGTLPIVGHNLPFDLRFLCPAGLEIHEKQRLFDTLVLARRTVKKAKKVWDSDLECYVDDSDPFETVLNYKLNTLCEHYLICSHCDHRAAGDALAAGYLFQAIAYERTRQI